MPETGATDTVEKKVDGIADVVNNGDNLVEEVRVVEVDVKAAKDVDTAWDGGDEEGDTEQDQHDCGGVHVAGSPL